MTLPTDPAQTLGESSEDRLLADLAECRRALASLSVDQDAALTASIRRRERQLDQIDRAQASLKAKDLQLRQVRAHLESARSRFGFRAQRAIGRRLRASLEWARGGGGHALASVTGLHGEAPARRPSETRSQSYDVDRERALASAIVAGLPATPTRPDASVTVVLVWSGDASRLRVALQRLAETQWPELEVRVVSTSVRDDRLPADLAHPAALIEGQDPEESLRLALEGLDSDYVLFLSDAIEPLESGWLARLIGGAHASGAGASGVRLVFGIHSAASSSTGDVSADPRLSHVGVLLRMVDGLPRASTPAPDADPLDRRYVADRSVAAVDGGCLLVRRQALADIGPVRAGDLEGSALSLGLRLRQHGWAVRYVGSAVAWDRREGVSTTVHDDPDVGALDSAALFREVMSDRLSGSFAIAEGPVHVGVVGRAMTDADGVRARLVEFGMDASAIDRLPSTADIDPTIDVVLLLDPMTDTDALPRHVVTAAWLGDRPDPWVDLPRFNDLDIVLVADDLTRSRVEAHTAKAAWVAPDPATAAGAQAFKDSLKRWVAARRVAIHIGPLTWEAAAGWGDTPFGRDIQKGFERRGWPATVHVFVERDSAPAVRADLALHIFGVRAPAVRLWQISVLWIISHPDFVRRDLCLPYDVVGVASDQFLGFLRGWLGADAPQLISLHQATDPDRFFPEPGGPAHDLLFVGSSRKVRRPIPDALAGTSHDFAVYGRNWTADLLDPRYLRGEWIPNDGLRRHYASAAIVLSDSWADMRDEGFIANRVYDALASGGLVISEAIHGVDEEFDGAVVTYRDRDDLLDRIEYYLARPGERAALADKGRRAVLARHTFGHRVDAILEAVEPLLVRLH